eukprot:1155820-Pelagomonas_calceolata.AAC.1
MGDENSRKRTKKGADGEYKAKKPHGLINKFQAAWYDPLNCPFRKHWLKDDIEYLAQCILCQTSFQGRAACVNAHEQGKTQGSRSSMAASTERQSSRVAALGQEC